MVLSFAHAAVAAAMESVFGYVSVLPSAFSAYRWKAIRGEPLNAYFTVEESSVKDMGPFLTNLYLAEDRVSRGTCPPPSNHRLWCTHPASMHNERSALSRSG